jgi:DNA-binding NtrC family response regulator
MEDKKTTLLLVDDNKKFLESLAQRAKLKGFHVLTAENGTSALEIAEKNTIDIAVVDQQMPDMEGLVVITKLKAISPDINTMLLTGHGDDKLKEATKAINTTYFDKENISDFWSFLENMSLGIINILLVDDNPNFLNTLAKRIRIRGYDPLTAANGKEALHIMEGAKVHFAIVDHQMPDTDGLVLITQLKKIDPSIQTLLLTGHGDDKLKNATEALNSFYFDKEDMGGFWGVFRKVLNKLESSMAAAGMAEGGDIEDAMMIDDPKNRK